MVRCGLLGIVTNTYGAMSVPMALLNCPTGFSVTLPGAKYLREDQEAAPETQVYPSWGARSSTPAAALDKLSVEGLKSMLPRVEVHSRLLSVTSAEPSCWIATVKLALFTIVLPVLFTVSIRSGAKPAQHSGCTA
jgi:hypothetical protein